MGSGRRLQRSRPPGLCRPAGRHAVVGALPALRRRQHAHAGRACGRAGWYATHRLCSVAGRRRRGSVGGHSAVRGAARGRDHALLCLSGRGGASRPRRLRRAARRRQGRPRLCARRWQPHSGRVHLLPNHSAQDARGAGRRRRRRSARPARFARQARGRGRLVGGHRPLSRARRALLCHVAPPPPIPAAEASRAGRDTGGGRRRCRGRRRCDRDGGGGDPCSAPPPPAADGATGVSGSRLAPRSSARVEGRAGLVLG
mmetsp:Transcript_5043/g.16131  ORF Transcript_5043/g.16131 Transcript_5043/m.16131 type:complete len:257 (-) Transcript_5043:168-938(-)